MLEVCFFNFIFATNLIIIIVMDKKDIKELDAVGLRDYYSKLSRSEKGRFLRYLVGEMGLGYNSMVVKFNNHGSFTKSDEVLINLAINNESLWRG